MPELTNPQHEKFARLLADGSAKLDAYLQAFPEAGELAAKPDNSVLKARASRLSRQPHIEERLIELLEQSADDAAWALTERLDYLQDVAETPYSELDDQSPICQGIKHTAMGVEYKMPDKFAAVALYGKLSGERDPAVGAERNLMRELINDIRSNPRGKTKDRPPRQKLGHPLTNARHEKFAQLVGSGERAAYAYSKVYAVKPISAGEGYRLKQQPEVAARIREIQNLGAAQAGWTRNQRMRYLKTFALTPIGKIGETSPYCQGVRRTQMGVEIKIPSRVRAVALYSDLDAIQQKKKAKTIEQIATNLRSEGNHAMADGIEQSLIHYLLETTG